jgi:hypothetical protein
MGIKKGGADYRSSQLRLFTSDGRARYEILGSPFTVLKQRTEREVQIATGALTGQSQRIRAAATVQVIDYKGSYLTSASSTENATFILRKRSFRLHRHDHRPWLPGELVEFHHHVHRSNTVTFVQRPATTFQFFANRLQ